MVDLRRDLVRGEDVPLLSVTHRRRAADLPPARRCSPASTATRGHRETATSPRPRSRRARCPPSTAWTRPCRARSRRTACASTATTGTRWLPTTRTPHGHPGDRRLALRHLDDGLHQRRRRGDDGRQVLRLHGRLARPRRRGDGPGRVGCRRRAGRLPRGAAQRLQRRAHARGRRHRRRPDPLPQGAGAPAVVPRGRRLLLRPRRGRGRGGRQPRLLPRRGVGPGGLLRAVRRLDGDHGPHHRDPGARGGRLAGATAGRRRHVGVLLARPARLARALLPGLRLGAVRAHARGPDGRAETVPAYTRGELARPSRSRRPRPAPPARRRRCRSAARPRRPTPPTRRATRAPRSRGWRSCWRSSPCCSSPSWCSCPAIVRRQRRERRLTGGIEEAWQELRDLRHRPGPRLARRSVPARRRHLARRALRRSRGRDGALGPPAAGQGPGARGRRCARPAGARARADPLCPLVDAG